ncbi:unnamed protein product, partial [Prorocentrum cordatum]
RRRTSSGDRSAERPAQDAAAEELGALAPHSWASTPAPAETSADQDAPGGDALTRAFERGVREFHERAAAAEEAERAERVLCLHRAEAAAQRAGAEKRRLDTAHLRRERAIVQQYSRLRSRESRALDLAEACTRLTQADQRAEAAADQVRMATARRRSERAARRSTAAACRSLAQTQGMFEKVSRATDLREEKDRALDAAQGAVEFERCKLSARSIARAMLNSHEEQLRRVKAVRESNSHRAQVLLSREREEADLEQRRRLVAAERERRLARAAARPQDALAASGPAFGGSCCVFYSDLTSGSLQDATRKILHPSKL